MLLLLGILAVSPARAKVTPIHEYELKQLTEGKIEYSCSNYNYFTSTQPNAVCSQVAPLPDGTVCYDCHCDTSKYKYSCTGVTGITGGSDYCDADGDRKYSSCACAEGYIAETAVNKNLASIEYPELYTGDDNKTKCYNKTAFTCKTNYKKFTSDPASPYVVYTTQTPFSGSSLECVSGYSNTGNRYYESRPENTDCLEMGSISLDLLPTPKNLYYFNGNCSSSTECTTTTKDCVLYNPQTKTTKDGGSVTCNKISGCQSGIVGSYICGSRAANSTYFSNEKITDGSATCYKVTGCNTGNDYKEAYRGTSPASDYTTSSSTPFTYTVRRYITGSTQLICRMPSGCRTDKGYYNFACDGGCWDGWLSLWAQ